MKKILVAVMTILLVTGCSSKKEIDNQQLYQLYYDTLVKQSVYETKPANFSVSVTRSSIQEALYRYDIKIENPRIYMSNVQIFGYDPNFSEGQMLPSFNIFNKEKHDTLIPNQVASDYGYPKGIILSFESKLEKLDMGLMIRYSDEKEDNTTTEFIKIKY